MLRKLWNGFLFLKKHIPIMWKYLRFSYGIRITCIQKCLFANEESHIVVAGAEIFGPRSIRSNITAGFENLSDKSLFNQPTFVTILNNSVTKIVKIEICYTAAAIFQIYM